MQAIPASYIITRVNSCCSPALNCFNRHLKSVINKRKRKRGVEDENDRKVKPLTLWSASPLPKPGRRNKRILLKRTCAWFPKLPRHHCAVWGTHSLSLPLSLTLSLLLSLSFLSLSLPVPVYFCTDLMCEEEKNLDRLSANGRHSCCQNADTQHCARRPLSFLLPERNSLIGFTKIQRMWGQTADQREGEGEKKSVRGRERFRRETGGLICWWGWGWGGFPVLTSTACYSFLSRSVSLPPHE